MYSPKIPEALVRRTYRAGKAVGKPMTRIVAEALERYLDEIEGRPHLRLLLDYQSDDGYTLTPQGAQLLERARQAA